MTTRRHPRTLNEAFPRDYAWRDVVTHYPRPMSERVVSAIGHIVVLLLFAAVGVLLAWRG